MKISFLQGKKKLMTLALTVGFAVALAGCGQEGTVDGDASIGAQVNYQITGIDPGAGLMRATDRVLEEYELDGWRVQTGSGPAMTAALTRAYNNEEPIIVTGWTPHWKFSKFDLKYLDDPKGIYGDEEFVHTIVRLGLKDDHPAAYEVLDRFAWTPDDMASIMVMVEDGMQPTEAAASWIADNAETVATWTEGVEAVDGDRLTLAYVAWDSEIASNNVIAQVLETVGYDVTLRQVEPGPMWAGVADGSADAMVAAWLPTTHADYYSEFEGRFEDLGVNMVGTRIGLVVPAYMDIDSIEDLNSK
ncbi:glycine betaine ABC transporter substrate-binding protein [Heliorestis convoluta]|uniref:Glycine betaine/carnitine transport binding protein GbuC n=1 Tax=Heliorestis convoluta TaxID=356322 RepID=A0A5Q2N4X4_9FIRM|nr:glycine betaine ABC transporter substrate-binding protein [Heliorestis convoluta]QGG49361.1 glycine betaine/carnitine transport binding protein GbuC [Heliorestis convoluta]